MEVEHHRFWRLNSSSKAFCSPSIMMGGRVTDHNPLVHFYHLGLVGVKSQQVCRFVRSFDHVFCWWCLNVYFNTFHVFFLKHDLLTRVAFSEDRCVYIVDVCLFFPWLECFTECWKYVLTLEVPSICLEWFNLRKAMVVSNSCDTSKLKTHWIFYCLQPPSQCNSLILKADKHDDCSFRPNRSHTLEHILKNI